MNFLRKNSDATKLNLIGLLLPECKHLQIIYTIINPESNYYHLFNGSKLNNDLILIILIFLYF